jgi:hypothetical protein
MGFLLLPPDERVLVDGLVSEFGLTLLAHDAAPGGKGQLVSASLATLPSDLALPARPGQMPSAPTTLLFWHSGIGPIRTLGDAPPSSDPRDRVADLIVRESAQDWADLIDLARTPVIRFARSHWHDDAQTRLQPGLLGGMAVKAKEQPAEVRRLHARVVRWMKKRGERLNPFEHCTNLPREQPLNLSGFWVWAWPEAQSWVRAGGQVWPWTG